MPTTSPADTSFNPCPTTIRRMAPGSAPSASRTAISRTRSPTVNASRP